MPPKVKVSKEQLLSCAYGIAEAEGISAVTSRSVAKAAGCSVQPVFSHFPTMEDLRQETFSYACSRFLEEVMPHGKSPDFPAFLSQWTLDLARYRPNLFQLLYLSEGFEKGSMGGMMMNFESNQAAVTQMVRAYGLSREDALDILVRSCLLLMGISTMICVNHMEISDQEALSMMGRTVNDMIEGKKRK